MQPHAATLRLRLAGAQTEDIAETFVQREAMTRIVYANLGYLRAINGSIRHHLGRWHHHVYTPLRVQTESIAQLTATISRLDPDLCCLVEVDRGSITNRFYDQFPRLQGKTFVHAEAHGKYGLDRRPGRLALSHGKSNAFLAKRKVIARDRYLQDGKKKLVHEIRIDGVRILVVHLSLAFRVRSRQIAELADWIGEEEGPTILVGDFNVFRGERELLPLLKSGHLIYANRGLEPTFRLGPYRAALDTCLMSKTLAEQAKVSVVDQPYSDHQMLFIELAERMGADEG